MSFSDSFESFSQINTEFSDNYIADARQLVCQTRNRGSDFLAGTMTNLGQWSVKTNGSASVCIVSPGEEGTANPAGISGYQLSTGGTIGSACEISMKLAELKADYGIFMMPGLSANSGNVQDALSILAQNTVDNTVLNLLYYSGGLLVQNGAGYTSLSTHAPTVECEWWVEVLSNAPGNLTINLYAGTQLVSTETIVAAIGDPANAGNVSISQLNGATANQVSQLGGINIGITQLPDDAVIQSTPYTLQFNASALNLTFLVEDVCDDVVLGTDFTAQIGVGATPAWTPLVLTDRGAWYEGIIDFTKPVRVFTAPYAPSEAISAGTPIVYKAHMLNGKFMALLGVTMVPTSIY
jgi:hypothetical protein